MTQTTSKQMEADLGPDFDEIQDFDIRADEYVCPVCFMIHNVAIGEDACDQMDDGRPVAGIAYRTAKAMPNWAEKITAVNELEARAARGYNSMVSEALRTAAAALTHSDAKALGEYRRAR